MLHPLPLGSRVHRPRWSNRHRDDRGTPPSRQTLQGNCLALLLNLIGNIEAARIRLGDAFQGIEPHLERTSRGMFRQGHGFSRLHHLAPLLFSHHLPAASCPVLSQRRNQRSTDHEPHARQGLQQCHAHCFLAGCLHPFRLDVRRASG
jgi:hypothetical protein